MSSGPCSRCASHAREVQWSQRLKASVCLPCYLSDAPQLPADWVPYEAPAPPPPAARTLALQRVHAAMRHVAPVAYSDNGVVGTCPLCRRTMEAHVGAHVTVLECDSGCAEDAIWIELHRYWSADAA